jgi:hypothetical protein
VQETAARYTYRLRYTIDGSPVDQLSFTLPAAYAPLVAVESKALRAVRQEPAADGRQRWVVTLRDETTGVLDIAVNFAVPLEANTTELAVSERPNAANI